MRSIYFPVALFHFDLCLSVWLGCAATPCWQRHHTGGWQCGKRSICGLRFFWGVHAKSGEFSSNAELDAIRATEEYDAVVLGEALSKDKLNGAAQLIRRRWSRGSPRRLSLCCPARPLRTSTCRRSGRWDRQAPGRRLRSHAGRVTYQLIDDHAGV